MSARRFQFVWWGLRSWGLWAGRDPGALAEVYRWRLRAGPLEIRRWR